MTEPTAADIQLVFETWRKARPNPEYCKLTEPRKRLIRARLGDYPAADLCWLMRYAAEADTAEARFWRGANDRRAEYMDLVNLLRVQKLDGRMERAMLWRDAQLRRESAEETGMDLGPMGRLLRRPFGEA